MLVEGKWQGKWNATNKNDKDGKFERQPSTFRNWITPDGSPGPAGEGGFEAEKDRYHLYISYNCPWACRTLMVRKLKKLEDVISVLVVKPAISDYGWEFGEDFPGSNKDELNGKEYLHEVYTMADPKFTGRVTVPVLWDKKKKTIVNNESADIIRMLNSAFDGVAGDDSVDLYPQDLREDMDPLNKEMYEKFNNGVYRTGFAGTQEAYEESVREVFDVLDMLDERLSDGRRFLMGDTLTEADIRAFVTLVRFDAAYNVVFKCNIRRVKDYDHLPDYIHRVLDVPGIEETVHIDHIKKGYFSIGKVNPLKIVAVGPEQPI